MLIKILINSTLTACAASVPVAAGTYVYLCSEEAKALSHESLSLKILKKKPVTKPKPTKKEQKSPPQPSTVQGSDGAQKSSTGVGPSSSDSSTSPKISSSSASSSVGTPVTTTSPSSPPTTGGGTTPTPQTTPTLETPRTPSPTNTHKSDSTSKVADSAPPQTVNNPPIQTPPSAPAPSPAPVAPSVPASNNVGSNTGTQGKQMTVEQLRAMISVDSTLSEENKEKWKGIISALTNMSEDDKNSLMSNFKIS